MCAFSTKWETVSHKKKATSNDKKAARKNLIANAPTIDDAPPLKESETLYSAAFQGPKSQTSNANHQKADAPSPKKPQSQKKKKDSGKKKLEKFSNLQDALKNISLEEVTHQWEDVRTRCPDAPSLWLGDIVGFLNRKLEVKEGDHAILNEPADFPCCALDKELKDFLNNTLVSYEFNMLKEFFDYCLREMLSDLSKGQSVYAYRIYLQLLVWRNPQLITKSCKIFLELARKRQNDKVGCLAVLWTVNQAGVKNSVTGLQVWSQVMLPMLTHKITAPYVVESLERIFRGKLDSKKANSVFGPTEFFPLLDVVFTSNATLPPNLQKQLQFRYAKLKAIAVGSNPERSLRAFFPSFLKRTTKNCPEPLKAELLKSLIECLATDVVCFSVWRQMYDSHIPQSGILLNYMKDNWSETSAVLQRNEVHETIRAFSLTNEELADSIGGRSDYETCRKACQFLLEKMQGKSFPWKTVLLVAFCAIFAFFGMDIIKNQGFQNSKTREFLDTTGLLLILNKVWNKISFYQGIIYSWFVENVPGYYEKTREICGPYFNLLGQKLYWLGLKILEILQPLLAMFEENAPKVLHWIEAQVPFVLETVEDFLFTVWEYVVSISLTVSTLVSPFLLESWDAISHYTAIVWESMTLGFAYLWSWLKNFMSET